MAILIIQDSEDSPKTVLVDQQPEALLIAAPGPRGATGAQGPPGPSGAGAFYIHTQSTPSSSWVIPHNIGRFIHITLLDVSNEVVYADVVQTTSNTATITFASPQAGYAYLS